MKLDVKQISTPLSMALQEKWPDFMNETVEYNRIVMAKDHAWGIYSIRYNIWRDKNPSENSLDFAMAIDNLKKFDDEQVALHTFWISNKKLVIIFSDIMDMRIIGSIPW